jgi:hypothetical protein
MSEARFQRLLIAQIRLIAPEAIIMKTDPTFIQGFPDLLILYKDKWAALEVKKSSSASKRANQDYYIDYLNKCSYAAFVTPENKEEVLNGLRDAFGLGGSTCFYGAQQTSLG